MKRSLHFGLNRVDPDFYGGWPGWLAGCWKDADDMAATMAGLGFEAEAFYDSDCTLELLREKLKAAAAASNAGDTFLFSFSGHGGQAPDADDPRNMIETLCCYNGQMPDKELQDLLTGFFPGVNVILIFDSCHSGDMHRSTTVTARVAPLFITKQTPVTVPVKRKFMANGLQIAACEKNELAGDGDDNGAFTGSWLKALGDNTITWRVWFTATARLMSPNFPTQHPTLVEFGGKVADKVVSA